MKHWRTKAGERLEIIVFLAEVVVGMLYLYVLC